MNIEHVQRIVKIIQINRYKMDKNRPQGRNQGVISLFFFLFFFISFSYLFCHLSFVLPKLLSDLVDAVNAADNQHLVVELGRHAHEQVHVEVVVMGHEWFSCRTTLTKCMMIIRS